MDGPNLWSKIQQVLFSDIRQIGDLFMAVTDTGTKIIEFGNAILDFRAKVGALDSKARDERMGWLIQLQVAAMEAVRVQDAKLEDAYAEYTAAFQVSTEAEVQLAAEMKDVKRLLEKREESDPADPEMALLRAVVDHLQVSSRLTSHLEQTDRTLMQQSSRGDQQRNQLAALDLQMDVLKKILGI